MSVLRTASVAACLLVLGACAATAPDPKTQSLVESIAADNPDVVRLTVHAMPAVGAAYQAVASTSAAKLGARSDPEDLRAMETGEVVVLDETGAIDVTVPIQAKGGKHTAAVGVTVKDSVGRERAMTTARSIASTIDAAMSGGAMPK